LDTVGCTVGYLPPYDALARLAASCFTANTGLDAVIIGPSEAKQIRSLHPASWRLWAFDFVDAGNIAYFDADWFCIGRWDPSGLLPSDDVIASQDFISISDWPLQDDGDIAFQHGEPSRCPRVVTSDRLRRDYIQAVSMFAGITTDPVSWINTGLMLLNRSCHEPWLRSAQQLYLGQVGHHPDYYEHPSLVRAASDLSITFQYLPRRFNVLAAGRRRWPRGIIGLHVKAKHYPEFVQKVVNGTICSPEDVQNYFSCRQG